MEIASIVKALTPAALSFFMGIMITPLITNFLYSRKMWKKKGGKKMSNGEDTVIFNSLHEKKEVGTPKLGGAVIWLSVFLATLIIWVCAKIFSDTFGRLDFLSRSQTWIPLTVFFIGAIVGAMDDLMEIRGDREHFSGGLSLKKRLLVVGLLGLLCGLWFYIKLDIYSLGLPFNSEIYLGPILILLVPIIMIFIYSGGVIDGLDGLAGGVFATIYACYGIVAFFQNQIDVAALCSAIVGGILAFLWFNIPPARFFMSETGTMALTSTLTVIALMTDRLGGGYGILVLPVIALPLFITTASNIIQIFSKKIRKKKVFMIAPLHHHFEAIGWPAYKITMRYWIISIVCGSIGVILALI